MEPDGLGYGETARRGPGVLVRRRRALAQVATWPIFESLAHRDFRWIWASSLAAFLAINMQVITRGWLVLTMADDSPLALALVMLSFALPMTVMSPLGGAMADRIPRRRIIWLSLTGNAAVTLALATLDLTGLVRFWHLLALGVLNGSLAALNMPSHQAILSEMVPEERLMNAVSLINTGMNVSRILGPALAGFLILYIGTEGVFYLIAAVFALAALLASTVRAGGEPAARGHRSMGADIGEGLSYAFREPALRGLVLMALASVLFGMSYFSLLPAWAREALDVGSEDLGLLMTVMGAGALMGSLGVASLRSFRRRGLLLLASGLAWGLVLASFSQTGTYSLAIPLLLLLGLVTSVFMALNLSLLQVYSAPEMRGRVMSIAMMTFGLMPLSAVPFGALAEGVGTPDALLASGLLLVGLALVVGLGYAPLRRLP